jgi:hypothetical protein
MIASRQQVEIASKFYQAQKAMKFLYGGKYDDKISETKVVIQQVAAANKCDVIPAVQLCVEHIVEQFPYDNGLMVAMLLATAVEMIENE